MLIERSNFFKAVAVLILLALALYGINYQPENKDYFKFCAYVLMALDIYMAFRNKENIMLFFVYIMMLYFNFSFVYDLYIKDKPLLYEFYLRFSNNTVLGKGIYMMLVFSIILLIFDFIVKSGSSKIKTDFFIKEKNKNTALSWFLLLFAFISSQIWWQLFEYSGVMVILAIFYSGKDKLFRNVCLIYLIYIFIVLNINGMRVPGLVFPIVGIFMFFSDLVNYKLILGGVAIAIITMTYSGLYTDTEGHADIGDAVQKLENSGGALDTVQFSYMSSQIGIKVTDDILTDDEREKYLMNFLKSQVALDSKSVDDCKMCKITKRYFPHFDGQFFVHTFYFYLGWLGVVLSGIIAGAYIMLMKKLNDNSSNVIILLSIWAISMIAKWYLYEPNALLKGTLFLLIIFAVCEFINSVMKKNDYIAEKQPGGYNAYE